MYGTEYLVYSDKSARATVLTNLRYLYIDLILGFIDGLLLGSARLLLIGWLYYYFVTYASRIVTYSLRKVRPQGHRTPLNFRPSRTEWMDGWRYELIAVGISDSLACKERLDVGSGSCSIVTISQRCCERAKGLGTQAARVWHQYANLVFSIHLDFKKTT